MKNQLSKLGMALLLLFVGLSLPLTSYCQISLEIQVSPSVLNIQMQGQVVTVHTDIAYSAVDAETVTMNGVEIDHWKADNQGNFVAKFLVQEIVGIATVGELNDLTLEGVTTSGESFEGTDEVMVINSGGKK